MPALTWPGSTPAAHMDPAAISRICFNRTIYRTISRGHFAIFQEFLEGGGPGEGGERFCNRSPLPNRASALNQIGSNSRITYRLTGDRTDVILKKSEKILC